MNVGLNVIFFFQGHANCVDMDGIHWVDDNEFLWWNWSQGMMLKNVDEIDDIHKWTIWIRLKTYTRWLK